MGGSVSKFYLHQSKTSWMLGNNEISEIGANNKANEIIDELYNGYQVIENCLNLNTFDSIDDYKNLSEQLKGVLGDRYSIMWIPKIFLALL